MKTPITITIPDTVRISGLSRTTIYEALKRGDLTAFKAGRRTLIRFADLEAYMNGLPAYQAGSQGGARLRYGASDIGRG